MKEIGNMEEQIEYYVSLPYTTVVERMDDQGTYYVARVLELDGLIMTGDTPAEALEELESVKRDWFETSLELGHHIPMPLEYRKFSGQISLRIPPSLHKVLAGRAEMEGVSLNQYMTSALAQSIGQTGYATTPEKGKRKMLAK